MNDLMVLTVESRKGVQWEREPRAPSEPPALLLGPGGASPLEMLKLSLSPTFPTQKMGLHPPHMVTIIVFTECLPYILCTRVTSLLVDKIETPGLPCRNLFTGQPPKSKASGWGITANWLGGRNTTLRSKCSRPQRAEQIPQGY